ncbi:hypothetical protein ONB76_00360 [Candidatus Karelsulcia muelleri]|uniref:DNA polymerase III delta prime subunit n=1 Tax=Candidatus Karelsulcia muelleri TaxID=336810 RepID=A0A346E0V8_9FLAO|nr:hypothetical protein [Candidatus Karelsulcia muelleri]AXN02613.1 DNA polymerase III delta prime subunit [Candidatus Karelsulcia muelleri]WDI79552.1 hypothetical protein ONB75_00070 [Candidatus Karelsulcia muelleri]WDR79010.1 hypothetical protein ONB76_00360 [Candidatus Karelsulcia muelleri]
MTHLKIEKLLYKSFKYNILPTGILIFGSEGCGHFKLGVKLIKFFFKKDILKQNFLPHPDILFMYPLPKEKNKIDEIFIKFLVKKPYASLFNWKKEINSENIDLKISLFQVEYILKIINIKPYELSHKIVIIWMSEYLNISANKKLLKILYSPIKNVIFVFISENENFFINNFKSLVYRINLNTIYNYNIKPIEIQLKKNLIRKLIVINILKICDTNKSYKYYYYKYYNIEHYDLFDKSLKKNFIVWMRLLFGLKNKIDLLFKWCSNINLWSRDKKKMFLLFSLEIFRIAHRYNYDKNYMNPFWYAKNFNWKNFCKYINTKKVSFINKLITEVIEGIENFLIFWFSILDLSFNLNKILY